jgi:hypothetical protein
MTIIAGELIRESFKLASVLGQDEEPQGSYAIEGLNFLNEIISQWGSLGVYIPYDSKLELTLQQGVSKYEISPVIAELLEGNITTTGNTPGSAERISVLEFATPKEANLFQNNIISRPQYVYLSRAKTVIDDITGELGSTLEFYPIPDSGYIANILLKYHLNIVKTTDTLDGFPDYYLKPLRYQLAKDLSALYKTELPPSFFDEYEKLIIELKSANPSDLTIQSSNPFLNRRAFKPYNYNVY